MEFTKTFSNNVSRHARGPRHHFLAERVNRLLWHGLALAVAIGCLGWMGRAQSLGRLMAVWFVGIALVLTIGTFTFESWYVTWLLPLSLVLPQRFLRYGLLASLMAIFSTQFFSM